MRTIVVVCVPTGDAGLSAEQVVVEPNNGSLPALGNQGARLSLEPARRDQLTPPFWTWFIENPRGRGLA